MRTIWRFGPAIVFLLCAMAILPAYGFAQTGAGQISGVVLDASKAVIPGVTITLTNVDTGVTATQLSNETGVYGFLSVQPGKYKMTASLPGFRQSVVNDLEIGTNVQLRYNFTLEIGNVTTEIQVSATATEQVLTDGATVGVVLPTDQIRELPMVTGNVLELLSVLPGYRESALGGQFDTVGGLGLNTVNATLNGISTNSTRDSAELWGRSVLTTTTINPDLVGEIRLILAPVDAELGRGNSQVQIQTRSGTNRYTGTAVWRVQNSAFSANTWGNNNDSANGQWAPTPLAWTNRHQITASYGGPIIRNKLFFFVLYDQQSVRNRDLISNTVLTDTARQGIFRYFSGWNPGNALSAVPTTFTNNPNGTYPAVDFDGKPRAPGQNPDGTPYSGGLYCFSVFGNIKADGSPFGASDCAGGTAVVRGSAWDTRRTTVDPTGFVRRVLDIMPKANYFAGGVAGVDGLNTAVNRYVRGRKGSNSTNATIGVVTGLTDQGNRKQINLKLDYNFNSNHRISGNWQYQLEDSTDNIAGWEDGLSGSIKRRPQIFTFNATSTLTSSLLNEARVGMNRSMEQSAPAWAHPTNEKVRDTALAFFPAAGKAANGYDYRVRFQPTYNGYLGGITTAFDFWNISPLYSGADTVRWTRGKHSLSFGGEFRRAATTGYNSGALPTATNGLIGTAPDYTTSLTVYETELPLLRQTSRGSMANLIYFLNGSINGVTHSYWIDGGSDIAEGRWEDVSTTKNLTRAQYSNEWSAFWKDDFKVTRRLTVNLGLRYDYYGSPWLGNGLTSATLDRGAGVYGVARPTSGDLLAQWMKPGALYLSGYGSNSALQGLAPLTCSNTAAIQPNLPAYAKPSCDPSLMSKLEFVGPGSANPGKSLLPTQGSWGPAVGFAWQIPWFGEGRTSLRGGWQRTRGGAGAAIQPGVFGLDGGDTTSGSLANHINDTNVTAITSTRALNLTDLPLLVPMSPTRATPGSAIPIAGRTRALTDFDPNYVNPYADNITLSVTRTISRTISLDTRYVGTFGRKQRGSVNLNLVNVYHNEELFEALEATRRGEDHPLFDQLLQGLNLNSTGAGVTLGYAAIGTTPTTGVAAGKLQRGSAHLRRAQATALANGDYDGVVNFLLGLTASTPGFQSAATLPAGVTQLHRVVRNGCDRMANGLTAGINTGTTVIPARCFPENYFTANPQLTSATMNTNYGRSNSHSFQTTATMRPRAGLSFSATYSWDKIMSLAGSNYTDPLNRELDYQASVSSNPMGIRANGTFDLPFGPNKLFFGSSSGIFARVVEGWRTSFIFNRPIGGAPRTVTGNTMLYGNGRPDVVGPWTNPKMKMEWRGNTGYALGNPSPIVTFADPQCTKDVAATDSMGFNLRTSCTLRGLAALVPAGSEGAIAMNDGSGRYYVPMLQQAKPGHQGTLGATTLRTPISRWSLNANASKTFRISESKSAQFRIDATNILNHPFASDPNFVSSSDNFGTTTTKTGTPRQFTAQLRLTF